MPINFEQNRIDIEGHLSENKQTLNLEPAIVCLFFT